MKSTITASSSLFLLTLLATTASATPGLFDDIHSDFDAEKTKVENAWSSATASTTSTSSTSTTATATATAYPGCTSSSTNSWCGITINTQQDPSKNSTPSSYNVTITDSKCNQVGSKTGVKPNTGVSLDTSVGNWEFGVYPTEQGLSLTYEGRNVSDYKSWQNWGFEYLNYTAGDVMVYGGITNCTSASNEKASTSNSSKDSSKKNGAATLAAGTGWMLAAVGFGMTAML